MATQQTKPMTSEVSIANQALSWLGQEPITSLDEDSRKANWFNTNYPFIRDALTEERMWTFATARFTDTTADMDNFESQFSHLMPTGWLSVYRVYRNVSSKYPEQWIQSDGWRREGDQILTDEATVYMWGMVRLSDTARMSSLFVQALAARLAADSCIYFTENRQLQADLWALYADKLSQASVRDGQQGANEQIQSNTLVNARWSSGGGR
jgi:hypothetical protein